MPLAPFHFSSLLARLDYSICKRKAFALSSFVRASFSSSHILPEGAHVILRRAASAAIQSKASVTASLRDCLLSIADRRYATAPAVITPAAELHERHAAALAATTEEPRPPAPHDTLLFPDRLPTCCCRCCRCLRLADYANIVASWRYHIFAEAGCRHLAPLFFD